MDDERAWLWLLWFLDEDDQKVEEDGNSAARWSGGAFHEPNRGREAEDARLWLAICCREDAVTLVVGRVGFGGPSRGSSPISTVVKVGLLTGGIVVLLLRWRVFLCVAVGRTTVECYLRRATPSLSQGIDGRCSNVCFQTHSIEEEDGSRPIEPQEHLPRPAHSTRMCLDRRDPGAPLGKAPLVWKVTGSKKRERARESLSLDGRVGRLSSSPQLAVDC